MSIHPAVLCGYDLTAVIIPLFRPPVYISFSMEKTEINKCMTIKCIGDKYNYCVYQIPRSTALNTVKHPASLKGDEVVSCFMEVPELTGSTGVRVVSAKVPEKKPLLKTSQHFSKLSHSLSIFLCLCKVSCEASDSFSAAQYLFRLIYKRK